MTSLQDMNARMAQWMAEKPTFDSGQEIRLNTNDMAIFQFVASGEDGDQFIKVYRSHILQAISKQGKTYNTHRYCPVQSGDDLPCPLCEQGIKDIKERMSIWMYVSDIMHAQLPQDKQFPIVNFEGRNYYHEEVKGFKIWHTSAWRDSPWQDIVKLGALYKGLHNFTAQLIAVGDGLSRRFKVFAVPNSAGLTPELYATAQTDCEALPELLRKQINQAVQLNPTPQNQTANNPQQQQAVPFVLGGQPATTFSIGGGQPQVEAPESQSPPFEVPPSQPEADSRRPLKSLF